MVLVTAVAVVAGVLALRLHSMSRDVDQLPALGARDLLAYWSAARLLRDGGDPYDPLALLAAQQAAGWPGSQPQLVWNPPWALVMHLPLALLPFDIATVVWFALQYAMVAGSGLVLWRYFAPGDRRYWIGLVLSSAFVPGLLSLRIGQLGGWLALAVTGFLWAERNRHDWLVGASLAVLCVKPHVTYLFLGVALWWAWRHRRGQVLAGWLVTLVGGTALASAFAPDVTASFLRAAARPPLAWFTPTLGAWLRYWIYPRFPWVHFVPSLFGVGVVVAWIARRPGSWNWEEMAPSMLLVSLVTAPYGWSFDHAVLLPVVMALVCHLRSASAVRRLVVLSGLAVSQAGLLVVNQARLGYQYAVWHPALLAVLWWLGRPRSRGLVLTAADRRRATDMVRKNGRARTSISVDNLTRDQALVSNGRVADNRWTRMRGLIGSKPLASGEGVLIVPCKSIHTHFMGFPIDVVYVNSEQQVVGIDENIAPWRLGGRHRGTRFVVELPAGAASASGTRVGDQLRVVGYRKWSPQGVDRSR